MHHPAPLAARSLLNRTFPPQSAVYGNFSAPKAQEVVVSRGKVLELLRPNDTGKLQTIVSTEVFGIIRSLAAFRITGGQTDYVVIGSDSGRIVILSFNKDKNMFVKVHQETFGRSGCRRLVPGQYLAVDPKGRALCIAAVEKQKFVYVLNRDTAANLTISSPLEAHKSHTIVFSVVGLDCGFDNPIFAAIELDYADTDQVRRGGGWWGGGGQCCRDARGLPLDSSPLSHLCSSVFGAGWSRLLQLTPALLAAAPHRA